jgi:hypothetical protein
MEREPKCPSCGKSIPFDGFRCRNCHPDKPKDKGVPPISFAALPFVFLALVVYFWCCAEGGPGACVLSLIAATIVIVIILVKSGTKP